MEYLQLIKIHFYKEELIGVSSKLTLMKRKSIIKVSFF